MNISKFIGCTLIVIGSIIGAGILALPLVIAGSGFVLSTIGVIVSWIFLTITGLLILEINLALPANACSFSSMAEKTLGFPGKTITWISYLLLLYSVLTAYMTGESALIINALEPILHTKISPWLSTLSFTFILGVAVFCGTKAVDYFNRSLISIKGFLLLATLALILPHVDITHLIIDQNIGRTKYLLAAAPIILAIFNFHFVIPSLRIYAGDKPKELKWIIILGTTTSLIIYLLWIIATLGTVPLTGIDSFTTLAHLEHPDTPDFIKIITNVINNKWVTASINGFFNVSMTTSFLGVSLGLFDFLADGFKRPNSKFGRLQTIGLTFAPPLFFSLLYPNGFVIALNYSASFAAILCLILPTLMVYRLWKSTVLKSPFRMGGGNILFTLLIVAGIILAILPILTNLHLLPSI